MIKYLILLPSIICMNILAQGSNTDALIKADIEFSNLSREKGVKEAFIAYTAENGVLLRPFMMPVVGYDAVKKFMEDGDSNFQLTWEPLYADISTSGEMGYTYGLYTAVFKDEKGVEKSSRGTYVSIWKKDKHGNWKFVLDTGNPGLEPKK
ncbi:MAG: nuclear transport factor 2 family protein [Ignavibacteria bacterium]|nr:nuclear transport factor 2 family protein [Ignavibacteria bacterium]